MGRRRVGRGIGRKRAGLGDEKNECVVERCKKVDGARGWEERGWG